MHIFASFTKQTIYKICNLTPTLFNLFNFMLLFLQTFGQLENDGGTGAPPRPGDRKSDTLVFIKLRVSDEPGNPFTIRIYGESKNITNHFGETQPYYEFLGIPYAKPPLNHLRFQRPTLDVPRRDFTANKGPSPCPQIAINQAYVGDENCLYLNIFAPQKLRTNGGAARPPAAATKLPVLVWFHGESFEKSAEGILSLFSSGSIHELETEIFVQNKVLVVTPQYRLGSLGFLSTANEDLNGNMGLFDQLVALEWTQKFISDFGGDPNQVTLMGHGSAAIGIGLLATSDLAKGLFHRIITMGGSALSPLAIDATPKATFTELALHNGCPAFPTLRFVRCLQKKSAQDIIEADAALGKEKHIGKSRVPHPVIQRDPDGRFLPPILSRSPLNSLASGNFEHVPIIIGVSSAEMSGFLPNLAGKKMHEIPSSIFSSPNILNQFIRAVLARSSSSNSELLADLVTFEYFAGLNVSDPARQEQALDIIEEVLSDFLFHMPTLSFARLWSRFAPVHFYVFDYVPTSSPLSAEKFVSPSTMSKTSRIKKRFTGKQREAFGLQASHGSDLRFLVEGQEGTAKDREISDIFINFWISFIHKGSPLHSGLDWPQFREATTKYLRIGDQVQIASGFRSRKDMLWNGLMDNVNLAACSGPGPKRRPNQNVQFELERLTEGVNDDPFVTNNLNGDRFIPSLDFNNFEAEFG